MKKVPSILDPTPEADKPPPESNELEKWLFDSLVRIGLVDGLIGVGFGLLMYGWVDSNATVVGIGSCLFACGVAKRITYGKH